MYLMSRMHLEAPEDGSTTAEYIMAGLDVHGTPIYGDGRQDAKKNNK